jgi:hypothetical protein
MANLAPSASGVKARVHDTFPRLRGKAGMGAGLRRAPDAARLANRASPIGTMAGKDSLHAGGISR